MQVDLAASTAPPTRVEKERFIGRVAAALALAVLALCALHPDPGRTPDDRPASTPR